MLRYIRTFFAKIFGTLWSLFLNGLLTILPITITVAMFTMSINMIEGWLEPIDRAFEGTFLDVIPHSSILVVILIIFLVGTILKVFLLRSIIHGVEALLFKLPLIRPVYSGIKQLIQAFSLKDKISFKKVVLVEFPRKGLYSLGFLTSEFPDELAPNPNEKFFNVFIPTTPNPTSGYFVVLAESEVNIIDLTRQEAMALIISGGIIQPRRYEKGVAKKSK